MSEGLDETQEILRSALNGDPHARNRLFERERPRLMIWVRGQLSRKLRAKYEPDGHIKGQYLVNDVRRTGAEGVIFASPSFCDPALLDRPMLQHALAAANIPYVAFKYAENSGQMQPIREQAGTFADSIKLWSGV